MSYQYDQYLAKHKENVRNGFDWLQTNLPELVKDVPNLGWQTGFAHDQSKSEPDEYEAYDAYFYGGNRSFKVVQEYRKAWLMHLHRNPHHWQHWVLINDDPKEGEILIEMPINYIFEMVCDWWAFSWAKGNQQEIFKWYDEHKNYMKLHPNTRKKVEEILSKIKEKLDGSSELAHHGVEGQKWGVRNGPPYPIKKTVEKSGEGATIEDTYIHKSVGAKARNYDILDPATGEYFHFSEGTRIRESKVFAGKGGVKELEPEVAQGLSEQIGGDTRKIFANEYIDDRNFTFLPQTDRMELLGRMVDVVEDWLEKKGMAMDDEAIIKGDDYDYLAEGFAAGMGISYNCTEISDNELLDKLCPNLDGPVPISMTLPGDFDGDELM